MSAHNNDKERVAYHEAGHAVLYYEFGCAVEEVAIKPCEGREGEWEGHVEAAPLPDRPLPEAPQYGRVPGAKDEERIMAYLAGLAVDRIRAGKWGRLPRGILNDPDWERGRSDWHNMTQFCKTIFGDSSRACDTISAYLHWMLARAQWFFLEPKRWARVEAVAKALLESERLEGPKVKEIIERAKPPAAGA